MLGTRSGLLDSRQQVLQPDQHLLVPARSFRMWRLCRVHCTWTRVPPSSLLHLTLHLVPKQCSFLRCLRQTYGMLFLQLFMPVSLIHQLPPQLLLFIQGRLQSDLGVPPTCRRGSELGLAALHKPIKLLGLRLSCLGFDCNLRLCPQLVELLAHGAQLLQGALELHVFVSERALREAQFLLRRCERLLAAQIFLFIERPPQFKLERGLGFSRLLQLLPLSFQLHL
mmetsp:Transcript_4656/g.10951  ORF Transcript_4656/g.10951 Transcript_4656/m.10951 type:complete len:225 (+) Transcript_4656:275-949(+)